MKNIFIIAILFWGNTLLYSQNHDRCSDALEVDNSVYGPVIPLGLSDSSLIMKDNQGMYFGKKHKVIWLTFLIPYDTVLTFDIIPVVPANDFDFILFRADRGDFCRKEVQQKILPVRTNFAKPAAFNKGRTGLSTAATESMVEPGFNSTYSSAINVKKGERYYLAVDAYDQATEGFTLKLNVRMGAVANNTESHIDAMPVKVTPMAPPGVPGANFFIHVLDSAKHPIKAVIEVDGNQISETVMVDTDNYSLKLHDYETIRVRANAPGHMPYQSNYTASGDTTTGTLIVNLEPIKSARKITLKNILFLRDSHVFNTSSKPDLDYLMQFLLSNPNVRIIIKGYVNDPRQEQSDKKNQALSEERANAVKEYLIVHGIEKQRMSTIGYGSTKMIYPNPINNDQEAANRRVEIEIQ